MRTKLIVGLLLPVLGACSVINSFEEVAPIEVEDNTGGSGGNSSGGMAGDSSGGTSSGGETMTGGMGGDSSGGTGGMDPVEAPPGLVVVMADIDPTLITTDIVFSALSPQTGHELAREDILVHGVAHEPERDVWYLLIAEGGDDSIHPSPAFNYRVEARQFDRVEDDWIVRGSVPLDEGVAPLSRDTSFHAVNGFVALQTASGTLEGFDFLDLDQPEKLGDPLTLDEPDKVIGLVDVALPLGGYINVARGCLGCELTLERFEVSTNNFSSFGTSAGLGTINGSIGVARGVEGFVAVTWPGIGMPKVDKVSQFKAINHTPEGVGDEFDYKFPTDKQDLSQLAIDPCNRHAFVTGPQLTDVVVVPMANDPLPAPLTQALGHNGKGLVFEPYTRTLLAPDADFLEITAFEVSGPTEKPDLSKRGNDWEPPSDLASWIVRAARPDADCPPSED